MGLMAVEAVEEVAEGVALDAGVEGAVDEEIQAGADDALGEE